MEGLESVDSVYSMSFGLFVFHLLIILLLIPKAECSSYVHDAGWCLKFFIITAAYLVIFLAKLEMVAWVRTSRILSLVFMIFMAVYIPELAYRISKYLTPYDQDED
jgi:hypothetical protein